MNRPPPTIDMLPDGSFRAPPQPPRLPLSMKVALAGGLVAVLGASLAVAFLAIWLVSLMLPVVIIGGGVAYLAMRWRRWQSLRGGQMRPGYGAVQPGRFGE